MNIEVSSKWQHKESGAVVEVIDLVRVCVEEYEKSGHENTIWYEFLSDTKKWRDRHVLTESDFLDQYKPYEPVYEYGYAYYENNLGWNLFTDYLTEEEAKTKMELKGYDKYQRLDFTKRERSCLKGEDDVHRS